MTRKFLSINNVRPCWQSGMCCFSSARLDIALIAFGIILRLKHYFTNSSFWLDEAWVAMDISTRTFQEIISAKIFSYDLPTAPPGFNLIEKSFITVFGNNEYTFRLFPLVCGIAAIFLFYRLLKRFVSGCATTIALAFFVCSDILIYHSSQLKQYSCGVFVVVLLYYLMAHMDSLEEISVGDSMKYGIAGGVAITLFYPSVFILAGIGLIQIAGAIYDKDWERFKGLMFSAFLWFVVFIIVYIVYCHYMFHNGIMGRDINLDPVWSLENLRLLFAWLTQTLLVRTAGFVPYWLGAYFVLAGSVLLIKKDKRAFFSLALPVFFIFLAMALKKYPIKPRFFVAFLPGIFILFAYGAMMTMQSKKKASLVIHGGLLCVLLLHPLKTAAHSLTHSYAQEETRGLVWYLKEHQQEGDALFINNAAQYVYIYYHGYYHFTQSINPFVKIVDKIERDEKGRMMFIRSEHYDFDENGAYKEIKSKGDWTTVFEHDFRPFGGNRRTWILLTHIPEDTREFILELLGRDGIPLKQLKEGGSALYLYDLSAKSGLLPI